MGERQFEETELRNFWRAVRNLRDAIENNEAEDVDFHLSEIDTTARFTDQRVLRKRCYAALSKHYSNQNVAAE